MFIFTISILVVFHEFGHYVVARLFRVKIITFAVGFGPKLFAFRSKSNEWRVGCIPLGGYVRMLDAREGEVPLDEKHLAFNYKKPYQKILIACAGPMFNVLFAILAYYVLALVGVPELRPVISSIDNEIAAVNNINIPTNSLIQKINGINVYTWKMADTVFYEQIQHSPMINLHIMLNNKQFIYKLDLTKAANHFHRQLYLENLGLYPFSYLPVIAYVEPSSPAAIAKLRIQDKIIAINQNKIDSWFSLATTIKNSPDKQLTIQVERGGKLLNLLVIPDSTNVNGQLIGKVGIMPTLNEKLLADNSYTHKYNLLTAAPYAFVACYSVIAFNISSLYGILIGQVSLHNLGGPISIAKASSGALALGIKAYIDFLALISISLAIMNLLPIPILDGGHIVIYLIEWIIGREVTHNVQIFIFKLGFVLLMCVTLFAIYNDILRL